MNAMASKKVLSSWLSKILILAHIFIILGSSIVYSMNYGDTIRLKHNATKLPAVGYLAARAEPSIDFVAMASGGKVVVVAQSTMGSDTDWIVGGSKPQGSNVVEGDVITLQSRGQNYYLASKNGAVSQASRKGGIFGQAASDTYATWRVTYPAAGQVVLVSQATGLSLTSQQNVNFRLGTSLRTEVCGAARSPLSVWDIEIAQAATPAPVPTPATPITPPIPLPIATPVATPIAAPVETPVAVPVATPIATPVETPVATAPKISGTGFAWGVNSANNIFFRNGITAQNPQGTDWIKVEGTLKQIAVGPYDGFIVGVSTAGEVFCRTGQSPENYLGTAWVKLPGVTLNQVSVGRPGHLWAVNTAGNIFYGIAATPDVSKTQLGSVDGSLVQIAAGINGQVWGVNASNDIYFREGITNANPKGTSWSQIPGKLSQVSVGPNGLVWALGGGVIYFRTGVTASNSKGVSWEKIEGAPLSSISIGHTGQVWGVGPSGTFFRTGITTATPQGTAWVQIPGAMASVSAGTTDIKALPAAPVPAPVTSTVAPITTPAPVSDRVVVAPEDFEEEVGTADSITVGSRNNDLEAWRVDADGKLYRYDKYTMAVNPWGLMDAKVADGSALTMPLEWISISSDGVMCILDHNGKAYMYDWDKLTFTKMIEGAGNEGLSLEFISVGNKDNIFAIDSKNRNILQYTAAGWSIVQKGEAVYVTVGADGTVVALNESGEVYCYLGDGKWDDMPGVRLARVAVGNAGNIVGVGVDGAIYTYSGIVSNRAVAVLPAQAIDQSATADTSNVAATDKGKVNKWKKKAKKGAKKAAAKKGQKGAGKKAQKKAAQKKAQAATAPTTTPTGAPASATNQSGQDLGKWVQVKGKGGVATAGFREIAINAAGTVFATDVNHNVYHKGDAGFTITKVTDGKIVGTPAPDAPKKMTRRQAKKAGKLDIAGAKKKVGKGQKNPNKKSKSRVVKTKRMKKASKKAAKVKQPTKKGAKKAVAK